MNIKLAWFYFNILFIANYSMAILRLFIRLPLPVLPNWANAAFLVGGYACTLSEAYKKPLKLVNNQNFLCTILFLTCPPFAMLAPFFILAVYHANSYALSQRRTWGTLPFFRFCIALGQYSPQLGRGALYAEIAAAALAIPLAFARMCSVKTLVCYYMVIRQQYVHNATMRSVVGEVVLATDRLFLSCPECPRAAYSRVKTLIGVCPSPAIDTAKKNE